MRLSAQEEYGLRCLVQVAMLEKAGPVQTTEIATREGLSPEYTAKLLRVLRQGELITSIRGAGGGYKLARPAQDISLWQAVQALDGGMFDEAFCDSHSGRGDICVHSPTACTIREVWAKVGSEVRTMLADITIHELAAGELQQPQAAASLCSEPAATPTDRSAP